MSIATIARGTIHLNPEGIEFSLPLDPGRYKKRTERKRENNNYSLNPWSTLRKLPIIVIIAATCIIPATEVQSFTAVGTAVLTVEFH
jgi:hypothetical protein